MKRYQLDIIGQLFSSTVSNDWSNVYRIQAGLNETVEPLLLQRAVDELRDIFPYFFMSLRRGISSYYFVENSEQMKVLPDQGYPLCHMGREEMGHFCLRVFYGKDHIAIEIFHAMADGHGAIGFFTALLHKYLELKNGLPDDDTSVLSLKDTPSEKQFEDSFLRIGSFPGGNVKPEKAFRMTGQVTRDKHKIITTGIVDSDELLEKAHQYGVSVTAFLTSVMLESLMALQDRKTAKGRKRPVRVSVAIDARKYISSVTMRNCAIACNPGLEPCQMGYSFEEICHETGRQLKEFTQKDQVLGIISSYAKIFRNPLIKYMPLVIKDRIIDFIYTKIGEKSSCINLSNLGSISFPENEEMHIRKICIYMGVQKSYHNNTSVLCYNGRSYISFTRTIEESSIEEEFFRRLRKLGLKVTIDTDFML